MGTIVFLLIIVAFLTGIVTLFLYKHKPKFLWLVPVATIIISGCLVLKDIRLYTTSEPTIARKLALYFHNDVLMGLYLIYAPITGIAVIMTVIAYVAYLFNHNRRKLDEKK
jgi:formate hydrogenlyase subunit 3/multisubunit Na+/H+ antiporter MnhD subunit